MVAFAWVDSQRGAISVHSRLFHDSHQGPAMVDPAQLEAFDGLLWVGSGQEARRLTSLSQPTISRAAHQVAAELELRLHKVCGEWKLNKTSAPLNKERQMHQLSRLNGKSPLRLEAGAITPRILSDPPLEDWVLGRADAINQPRSLALLGERVIDAWICTSALDLPQDRGEREIAVEELFRAPLRLVASPTHPLAGRSALSPEDVVAFPSVALADNWYPNSAGHLKMLGLWSHPKRLSHYRGHQWEERTRDGLTLAYASPLMLARDPKLHPLDFDLGLEQSVALVVLKEHRRHPKIEGLLEELHRRVADLQPGGSSNPLRAKGG